MHVTIKDGNTVVVVENSHSIDSARGQEILNILVSGEPKQVESSVALPETPRQFREWLEVESTDRVRRVHQLGELFGCDLLNNLGTAHNLVLSCPHVVAELGESRFSVLCKWLHKNRLVNHMPAPRSINTYYNAAVRSLRK